MVRDPHRHPVPLRCCSAANFAPVVAAGLSLLLFAGITHLPGAAGSSDTVPLEAHHTDFVLVPSSEWGGETTTMFSLARVLRTRIPAIAVLANGGQISKKEVQWLVVAPFVFSSISYDIVCGCCAPTTRADPPRCTQWCTHCGHSRQWSLCRRFVARALAKAVRGWLGAKLHRRCGNHTLVLQGCCEVVVEFDSHIVMTLTRTLARSWKLAPSCCTTSPTRHGSCMIRLWRRCTSRRHSWCWRGELRHSSSKPRRSSQLTMNTVVERGAPWIAIVVGGLFNTLDCPLSL